MCWWRDVDGMPDVKLKLEPSHEELVLISRDNPEASFWIRDSHVIEEGIAVLYEIRAEETTAIARSFADAKVVRSLEVLYTGTEMVLLQCVIDEPTLFVAARDSGNLARSPPLLRDGWLFVTFTTSEEGLARYRSQLESAEIAYQVLSITPSTDSADILTDRQREVITEAVDRGYYETPRECSLTELADALGVTKGSLSRVVHRAEGRIIQNFISA